MISRLSFLLILAAVLLQTCWASTTAFAQDRTAAPYANRQLENAALERQATDLMHSLRCLTCQGQSIADSDAEIAGDMRHEVRTRISAGETPEQIRAWLIDRYGDWVSYDPPMSGRTAPLWFVPLLLIAIALFVAWPLFRRRRDRDRNRQD